MLTEATPDAGDTGVSTSAPAPADMPAKRVYQAIYGAVLDHRLPPGTRLREEELAQAFGVSRTLVRQALHQLAQNGVVQLQPRRGAQVPAPTRQDGAHVFDARRVVECEVARRLSGQLSAAQRSALQTLVEQEAAALAAGDKAEAIRLSGEFHRQLAQMSGNPIFVRVLDELLPTTSLLMALYQAPGQPLCVAHSHSRLLQVLDGERGSTAAAEMRRHLNEIERSLSQPQAAPAAALRDVFNGYREPRDGRPA